MKTRCRRKVVAPVAGAVGVVRLCAASWATTITLIFNEGFEDYPLGSLGAGTHTLKIEIKTDSTDVIAESNEQDNEYTKTIIVGGVPIITPVNRTATPSPTRTPSATLTPTPFGNGQFCLDDVDCQSGFCTDGFCCASRSCPEGQRCNIEGREGACSAPKPTGGQSCNPNESSPCAGGLFCNPDSVCCQTAS